MRLLSIGPMLLRGRTAAGRGLVDLLSVVAFTVSSWLLLVVLAGVNAFYQRQLHPPRAFVEAFGADWEQGVAQLPAWTMLAACAAMLLVVPLITLGGAAARMGALGRDQRLATLRLVGATHGEVVALTALETMVAALAGAVLGTVGYLLSLPVWSLVTFEATPLSAGEMLLPAWAIGLIVLFLVLLSGVSSVTGLMRLRISPLGVARRQPRPALRFWRFAALPAAVAAWVIVAPMLNLRRDLVFGVGVIVVGMGVFMGVINLVGPWLLQLLGLLLVRSGSVPRLLAGRRLLAEPKTAWRAVSGLAFIGFTGGTLLSIPFASDASPNPLDRILGADLRTGTFLTLGIAFVVAATSTLLNQAVTVLDRRRDLQQLDHLGLPRQLHERIRLVEVVAPAALSALGSAGLAVFFFGMVLGVAGMGIDPSVFIRFGLAMLAGLALVWAAGEACRPLVRSALTSVGPRID